jgi:hypothetical protein
VTRTLTSARSWGSYVTYAIARRISKTKSTSQHNASLPFINRSNLAVYQTIRPKSGIHHRTSSLFSVYTSDESDPSKIDTGKALEEIPPVPVLPKEYSKAGDEDSRAFYELSPHTRSNVDLAGGVVPLTPSRVPLPESPMSLTRNTSVSSQNSRVGGAKLRKSISKGSMRDRGRDQGEILQSPVVSEEGTEKLRTGSRPRELRRDHDDELDGEEECIGAESGDEQYPRSARSGETDKRVLEGDGFGRAL